MTHGPQVLEVTWRWLAAANHPAANLLLRRAGKAVPWSAGAETDRRRLIADPVIQSAFDKQREDGSWGAAAPSEDRVLPTMWVLKTLVESGLDQETEQVHLALEFLSRVGRNRRGHFSTSWDDEGVFSCYVGLAAKTFYDAGRDDLVRYQLDWLTRFQAIRVDGIDRREVEDWGLSRDPGCGGCMSSTTCEIGVVRAAAAWKTSPSDVHREAYLVAREAVLDRGLAAEEDGSLAMELPSPGAKADGWVPPGFPLDWRIDLVTVLEGIGDSSLGPDARATRAIDLVLKMRRSDGAWSRGWHVTSGFLKGYGAPAIGEGNPIVTARVALALEPWLA